MEPITAGDEDAAIIGPDADKGWGIGLVGGALVGMGQSGFFFEMGAVVSGIVILIGAGIAGYLVGRTPKARAAFSLPFVVIGIGIAFAAWWYTEGRSSIVNYEVLIPVAIGCLPGVGVYFLVKKALLGNAA